MSGAMDKHPRRDGNGDGDNGVTSGRVFVTDFVDLECLVYY